MNLLKMYTPSINRIYGDKLSNLRESFQAMLLTMDSVQTLFEGPAPSAAEVESKLSMLIGSVYRHFENEVRHMQQHNYYDIETHMDKHAVFIEKVEAFRFNFPDKKSEENFVAYRLLQRWVTSHLLWDDAHLVQTITS